MARSASARPAGKRRPHGTILVSPGRRFTLEVTATIQRARAWRMITKPVIPRRCHRAIAGLMPQRVRPESVIACAENQTGGPVGVWRGYPGQSSSGTWLTTIATKTPAAAG